MSPEDVVELWKDWKDRKIVTHSTSTTLVDPSDDPVPVVFTSSIGCIDSPPPPPPDYYICDSDDHYFDMADFSPAKEEESTGDLPLADIQDPCNALPDREVEVIFVSNKCKLCNEDICDATLYSCIK